MDRVERDRPEIHRMIVMEGQVPLEAILQQTADRVERVAYLAGMVALVLANSAEAVEVVAAIR